MHWYVYAVFDAGQLLYIGKGAGNRYLVSAGRVGGVAGILEHFSTETKALKRERQLIAQFSPPLNKTKGGEGRSRIKRRSDESFDRVWTKQAYDRADKSSWWLDQLGAAAFARCELNSRGIKCPEEVLALEQADPRVVEAARRLSAWLQSKQAEQLRLITCS